MLVCPSCRTANPEGVALCSSCGRDMTPGAQLMRSRTSGPSQIEITPPPLPKRWPRLTAFVVVLAGVAAFAVWSFVRPTPCDGKFTSEQFSYCAELPAGWTGASARIGSTEVDQFVAKTRGTAFVMSVELQAGVTLDAYVAAAKRQTTRAGLANGDERPSRLGGLPAVEWDLTDAHDPDFHGLQVVTLDGDTGWTVQLDDSVAKFSASVRDFRSLLASWHFR